MPTWARQQFENNGLSIAKGEVPGYSAVYRNGVNNTVAQQSNETIWTFSNLYPWSALDTPQTLYIQSTDNNDQGTVNVTGLDADWNFIEETVSLTGTTTNTTVNQYRRINDLLYDNGDGENEGDITARVNSSTGTVVGHIEPNLSQSQAAIYTVPSGYTAFVTHLDMGAARGNDAQIRAFVRGGGQGRFRLAHTAEVFQGTYSIYFPVPPAFPERTDIDIRATLVENNGTRVFANFCITLIETKRLRK